MSHKPSSYAPLFDYSSSSFPLCICLCRHRGQKGFASVYMKKKEWRSRDKRPIRHRLVLFSPAETAVVQTVKRGEGARGCREWRWRRWRRKGGWTFWLVYFSLINIQIVSIIPSTHCSFWVTGREKSCPITCSYVLYESPKRQITEAMLLILSFVLLLSSQLHQRSYHSLYRRLHFVGLQHKERPSLGPLANSVPFLFSISADL